MPFLSLNQSVIKKLYCSSLVSLEEFLDNKTLAPFSSYSVASTFYLKRRCLVFISTAAVCVLRKFHVRCYFLLKCDWLLRPSMCHVLNQYFIVCFVEIVCRFYCIVEFCLRPRSGFQLLIVLRNIFPKKGFGGASPLLQRLHVHL